MDTSLPLGSLQNWLKLKLSRFLPFFDFKAIVLGSGYDKVDKVLIGNNTLWKIFDTLYMCYANPSSYKFKALGFFLQIIFVVLGEGPRFEIVRKALSARMLISHEDSTPLGALLDAVIHNWKNLSLTAFLLKLILLEEEAAHILVKQRPNTSDLNCPDNSLVELIEEYEARWMQVQRRCCKLMDGTKRLNTILKFKKDRDSDGVLAYGETACKQIIEDTVPYLLYMAGAGPPVMMRRDMKYFWSLFDFKVDQVEETETKKVKKDETDDNNDKEAKFWKSYKTFRASEDGCGILHIFDSSLPCLQKLSFSDLYPELSKELHDVCHEYRARVESGQSTGAASNSVKDSNHNFFEKSKLFQILDFLDTHSPVEDGSEKGRSFRIAKAKVDAEAEAHVDAEAGCSSGSLCG